MQCLFFSFLNVTISTCGDTLISQLIWYANHFKCQKKGKKLMMELSRSLLCGCKMEVEGCSVVLSFTWITYPHILHINSTSNTKTSHLIVNCHYLTVNIKDNVAVCGIIKANHTDSFFSCSVFFRFSFFLIIIKIFRNNYFTFYEHKRKSGSLTDTFRFY